MAGRFVTYKKLLLAVFVVAFILIACAQIASWNRLIPTNPGGIQPNTATASMAVVPSATHPEVVFITPTPDPPKALPTLRADPENYVVQRGDNLDRIARQYSISVYAIALANDLENPNLIEVGQVLLIPPPDPDASAPAFKIIPDSELVFGPSTVNFDIAGFIQDQGGYLANYSEIVDDVLVNGAQIVERIAREYSVNPRLLLSLLEYQSGWVTQEYPQEETLLYPMRVFDAWRTGLFRQLSWAANNLNRGYYLWQVNSLPILSLADGLVAPMEATVNAGTAGVQYFFSLLNGRQDWERAISEQGLAATFIDFFGNPFSMAVEPLVPDDLHQPPMQLPFEDGEVWSFTGGPHGGWGDGSGWAALDFAPPGEPRGCVLSSSWVVAVADGLVIRSENGAVVQDLSGDGYEQTGWTVLYLHIDSHNRVKSGTYLQAGDRIGHPSCEGGVSSGTHLHIARRYNGEWIPADQSVPFIMDGWASNGYRVEYNGTLVRDGQIVEALNGRFPANAIQR
ncbi:MAG: LysM peptidoglycan-binding domain-containing protein [Anaerolineales bacterium]